MMCWLGYELKDGRGWVERLVDGLMTREDSGGTGMEGLVIELVGRR